VLPTKIVVIGAGSASFGLGTLSNIMSCEELKGSTLALVDINAEGLGAITKLAQKMNQEWEAGLTIESSVDRGEMLRGAKFIILSIAVDREDRWKLDWEIPLRYGVRQPLAENGGPGAFAHTARNVPIVMDILRDIEEICPSAWLLNFTNPVPRICLATSRYSEVKIIGLCHGIVIGYVSVAKVLADDLDIDWEDHRSIREQAMEKLDIKAAGLNHFTWILDIRDKRTGEDLYPLFGEKLTQSDPGFNPLSRELFKAFGFYPVTGDTHIAEYLPWCHDPKTKPWEKYKLELYDWDGAKKDRDKTWRWIEDLNEGKDTLDKLRGVSSERAVEIILGIAKDLNSYELAVNIPNKGYITNLPEGAIVELPAIITGSGPLGVGIGDLPEPIATMCRNQLTVAQLAVDAAVKGCRKTALQALLMDQTINDIDTAKRILDDYLEVHSDYLPQFE